MIEAQAVVEAALAAASGAGADGCCVIVVESSHADVRFAVNRTTTNGVVRDRTVTVVCMMGQTAGVARRSGVVSVEQMVSAALTDARTAPPADDAFTLIEGMAAARGGRASAAAAVSYGHSPPETDLTVLGGVLSGLSGAFERAGRRDTAVAGFAEYDLVTTYMGLSTGVRLAYTQPTGALNLVGRSVDGARTAWAGTGGGPDQMTASSFAALEDELWRRLEWSGTMRSLDAGRYEVIMPPSAVADMMGSLCFYGLSGREAEDGRTVFARDGGGTRLGEQLSTMPFTLYSDPMEPGIECIPFAEFSRSSSDESVFDNGLPLGRIDWIRDGHLANLRHHRAGAARSGVDVAPYIDNLVLRGGDGDGAGAAGPTVDDMVARTEHGLLLTCLWYIREVDPATMLLTGLTRDGVYVVEDGAVVGAANNFRFNESPVDLLARATEVGGSVRALGRELGEYLNRTVMPPLRIPDFNMSTVSQAS